MVTYKALLDLHIDGPDSWRSELRHHIQNRKGLGSNQAAGDIEVKEVSNTVIKMGLVTLPLDSGPKLAWGSE